MFAAGQPIQATLLATRAGLPLVVTADCRGLQVGRQAMVSQPSAEGNIVTLPLADGIGGVIRLDLYDYSDNPPKLLAERLVYRRPLHTLNVRTAQPGRRDRAGRARRFAATSDR